MKEPAHQDLLEENAALRAENALLRQKVDLLIRKVFGTSSEKLDPGQLNLFTLNPKDVPGKSAASSVEEEAQSHPHANARRERSLPEDLPVVEEVIDPEEVKAAPEAWRCIGQEVSERLDYEPARFLRRRVVRRKYVLKANHAAAPVIAELPPLLQERGLVAPGLLAQIIVGKYCYHLPLYRQEQIYWTRHRVWLPRQNLARWMGMVADWLKPIYEAIRTGVMAGGYVQVDETPIRYLSPGHGKTKTGYFWALHVRAAMPSTAGKRAAPRPVWTRCYPSTSGARCNATAMPPTAAMLAIKIMFDWRPAGRTHDESFTKPRIRLR